MCQCCEIHPQGIVLMCVFAHYFFFISFSLTALQCYCDRCSANSSCTTDGVCFVAIRKVGSRPITEQRQCIHEYELIPRDRPFLCAPSVKDDTGIYPLCCTSDYCNKEPDFEMLPGKNPKRNNENTLSLMLSILWCNL